MEPHAILAFTFELARQARAGLTALKAAEQAKDADLLHDHISDFLNHAAVVSKILKPGAGKPDDRSRVRGRELRQFLGVSDKDPILDRTLRDLLEHIDEQIDAWAAGSTDGNVCDVNRGPVSSIKIGGKNAAEISLRHYDDTTGQYYVLGRPFDLKVMADSLRFILQTATAQRRSFMADAGQSRQGGA